MKSEKQSAKLEFSIHPRAWSGRAGTKSNTSAKSRGSVLRRKIAAVTDHIERTGDRTPHSHLSKLKAKLDALPAAAQNL